MKRSKLVLISGLSLAIACLNDSPRTPLGPNAMISDAAHNGTPGFYFLPPMVPLPSITHTFNAFLQPLVQICPLDETGQVQCAAAPIQFTRTAGAGSEVIRVNTVDRHYIVNWHTDLFAVQPEDRYRIQVFAGFKTAASGGFVGVTLLGFADVEIAATGKAARNISSGTAGTSDEVIGLVDGKTLPIKFFAGLGTLELCTDANLTCVEAIVPRSGGLVVAMNAEGEPEAFADFPENWSDVPRLVEIERIDDGFFNLFDGPLGAPEGVKQFPLFFEFTATPRGTFTQRVRIGVCNIEAPFADDYHPDDRGVLSLGIGATPDTFRLLPIEDASDILGACAGITRSLTEGEIGQLPVPRWLARLGRFAADALLPAPLFASSSILVDGGMGGSTDSFESPVATVELPPSPDFFIPTGTPDATPSTVSPGGTVQLSGWSVRNRGSIDANSATGLISNGFYLSTDPIITPLDTRLGGNSNTNGVLQVGEQFDWGGPDLTIPLTTAPGTYYVGILVDETNLVAEFDETNNFVSVAITVGEAVEREQVAFVRLDEGNSDVYLVNADGSGETNLTNSAAQEFQARWSPNGAKLLFTSNADGDNEIYVMNRDGSGMVQLTHNEAADQNARWSPDGQRIVFQSDRDENDEIYLIDASGENEVNLSNSPGSDQLPAWSPDGRQIAFQSFREDESNPEGDAEIYVMNADRSGVPLNITNDGAFDILPVWSPGGDRIAFQKSSGEMPVSDIYIMAADGTGEPQQITTHAADDFDPKWMSDGERLVFVSNRDGDREIFVVDLATGALTQLTTNTAADDGPALSPDGGKIVFQSNRDGNGEIYVMNADGSAQIRLTDDPALDIGPAWQPPPPIL